MRFSAGINQHNSISPWASLGLPPLSVHLCVRLQMKINLHVRFTLSDK